MNLHEYITLGRSGLKVSPLCLGTMTFGTECEWGNDEATAKTIFDHYLDAGGNFFDTADLYMMGESEEWLGKFVRDRKARDRAIIATKFTFNRQPGNPNSGGNGRKNILRAVDVSLKRLGTDYIDLYWTHVWDKVTPVEEVLATFHDLIQQGKIRYAGFSNVPAWYATRAQTLAEKEGKHRLVALQLEYSLTERNIEREHVPVAQEFGFGICPWSPLAGGFLTGRYRRGDSSSAGRLSQLRKGEKSEVETYPDKKWQILDALLEVAKELGHSPAQVALNWAAMQPGITSPIVGATKLDQLKSNIAALSFTIPDTLRERLDLASQPEKIHPYSLFEEPTQRIVNSDTKVHRWRG